jgi:hypothetical protein
MLPPKDGCFYSICYTFRVVNLSRNSLVSLPRNWWSACPGIRWSGSSESPGIGIAYKFRSGTTEVQGISFEKGDIKMKGSAIDRSLSYSRIDMQLNSNQQAQRQHVLRNIETPSLADQLREAIRKNTGPDQLHAPTGGKGLLETLPEPQFVAAPPDPMGDADIARKKRKKHEAEHSQSQGIGR